jgi:hypothetical protein
VLLPVLVQDPSVAGEVSRVMSIIHPVVAKDPLGFTEGPTCRRVAIVDLDFHTGRFGTPARFSLGMKSVYRDVAGYQVRIPTRKGVRAAPWSRTDRPVRLSQLSSTRYNDAFLKVSVFGIVLRTIALVQDPVALGREIRWAFPGEQLLVVPRAGALDNAFYHRDSRSLQFYYGSLAGKRGRAVFSALSQDIVAHETTHAIVDGIAPDLYNAVSPESLAIHEGLADFTAALVSMRNRELLDQAQDAQALEIQGSSRFTRIAEEFGRWRGYGDALRDVCNNKTLDPDEPDPARRVDASSPHSVSEVLSGMLFDVFRNEFSVLPTIPALSEWLHEQGERESMRWRTGYAVSRLLSLIYKGLDWLPPGEASFGELVRAMVTADEIYLPREQTARGMLLREARRRHVLPDQTDARIEATAGRHGNMFELLRLSAQSRRDFVERHREALRIGPRTPVQVRCRLRDVYEPLLTPKRQQGESFSLRPVLSRRDRLGRAKHLVVKLGWWCKEPNDIGAAWGRARRYKAGATVVFDRDGQVRAVLRAGADPRQTEQRSDHLKRLLLADNTRNGPVRLGPDGLPLQPALDARVRGGTLSVSGAFQALHVVGDDE